jgi:tetratricopeptide (TPR) repeat protein
MISHASLTTPTPLASALSALSVLAVAAVVFSIVAFLRGRGKSDDDEGGFVSKLLGGLGAADRFVISWTSWVTGTRYRRHWTRVCVMVVFFLTMSGLAALLPWPWGLFPIIAGLIGIFSVFRHYSRHEDEFVFEVPEQNRFIKIEGHLHREVVIAVSFLFVFAPIAFAQLQANGYGFDVAPEAGPFAFVIYTVIETLKSGSLVDYYDLYAERVGFAQISNVDNPSSWAKYAIMGYRVSLNLILLATIKRLIDIAGRRSRGLDMRHIEQMLRTGDSEKQDRGISLLRDHALEGNRLARLNAVAILSNIADPAAPNRPEVGTQTAFSAAEVLKLHGEIFINPESLRTAISGIRNGLSRANLAGRPDLEVFALLILAQAMRSLAETTGDTAMLEDSLDAYQLAGELLTDDSSSEVLGEIDTNIAWTELEHYSLSGDTRRVEGALTAARRAVDINSPDRSNDHWASAMNVLGAALATKAELERDVEQYEQAVATFKQILKKFPRAAFWANFGSALGALATERKDAAMMREAIEAHRASLDNLSREKSPRLWADRMSALGECLLDLYAINNDQSLIEEATSTLLEASQVYNQDNAPAVWASRQSVLLEIDLWEARQTGDEKYADKAMNLLERLSVHPVLSKLPTLKEQVQIQIASEESRPERIAARQDKMRRDISRLRNVLGNIDKIERPTEWIEKQSALADKLIMLGSWTSTIKLMEEAVSIWGAVVEHSSNAADLSERAWPKVKLGYVKSRVAIEKRDMQALLGSAEQMSISLADLDEQKVPKLWASALEMVGDVKRSIPWNLGGSLEFYEQSVADYESALRVFTFASFPEEWRSVQGKIGHTLQWYGWAIDQKDLEHKIAVLEKAKAAFQALLERIPLDDDSADYIDDIDELIESLRE